MTPWLDRRWNVRLRFAVCALPFVGGLVVLIVWRIQYSPGFSGQNLVVKQPVWFNHAHHVGELNIDCRYCHQSVETSAFAGYPSTEVCMTCHQHVWTGHPELEPVRASLSTGLPIAWRRVHDLPDHAYFDHSIHLAKGVGCVSCHGRVDQMQTVHKTETLYMEWCLECHRHPQGYLRPREQVFDLTWQPPEDELGWKVLSDQLGLAVSLENETELQAVLMDEYEISKATSCAVCHR